MSEVDWGARIREALDAFNRGDYEAALTHASDEVELRRIEMSPDSRDELRGRERVIEFLRPDIFVDQRAELVEFIPGEDGATITHVRFTGRGSGSGIELPPLEAYVVWRNDGTAITRIEFYAEIVAARSAAGLDPPAEGDGR